MENSTMEKSVTENVSNSPKWEIMVKKSFPNKKDLLRRIVLLWETNNSKTFFVRVNFYDPKEQNYIIESYFVEVSDKVYLKQ